jgi:transposase
MKKIKEIARLKALGLSQRQIARSLNISKGVVHKYLSKLEDKGLQWPLQEDEERLPKTILSSKEKFVEPDYVLIYQELKVKGVTLLLLHEEYKRTYPDRHYSYTQFCCLYRRWKKAQKLSLKQIHQGGDKLFIDYAGPKVTLVDPQTGAFQQASLFVAVMGASQYTFAEATWDQSLENWLGSHVRAFQYFGGVPSLLVPDNLLCGAPHNKFYVE